MLTDWPSMEHRGPLIDEAAVTGFESRLGHRLPEKYRHFVLEVNGGRPDDSCCEYEMGVITQFYSLADPDSGRDLEAANFGLRAPPDRALLSIGYDESGANILIVLGGDHRGEVWLQDVADPRPEGSNPRVLWHDRRDMKKIAESFDAFLRTLRPLSAASTG